MATDGVDALVIFGATGDLAKLETFPALVGLVERGVLDVPVMRPNVVGLVMVSDGPLITVWFRAFVNVMLIVPPTRPSNQDTSLVTPVSRFQRAGSRKL